MSTSEITQHIVAPLVPERPSSGHKGTFGHVFIIAGSQGYSGAAVLCGLGALRSGAGLVTVGLPRSLGEMSDKGLPEAMTFPLLETNEHTVAIAALEGAYEFSASMDAVVIGPGLSQHTKTREFILTFIEECTVPLVIDADGLNALQGNIEILAKRKAPTLVTPHPGEMARLTGLTTKDIQADREAIAVKHAKEWGCTVVLKGQGTIVASEHGQCRINTTGNPGMATGGAGDILAGLTGGLIAQGLSMTDAATLGVYLHGLAGDLAAAELTEPGLMSSDIADFLPEAWRVILESE